MAERARAHEWREEEGVWVGAWYAEPQRNRVSQKDGEAVSLEPKVMQVLACLVASAGKTVTKERFMDEVWSDTVVTPDVLPRCISHLRKVFDDDARNPRYIETIRKTGYRLTAPVRRGAPPETEDGALPGEAASAPLAEASRKPQPLLQGNTPAQRGTLPRAALWMGAAGVVALLVVAAALWQSEAPTPAPAATVPFTSFPGEEFDAAMSPTGEEVAFVWDGAGEANFDVYVKRPGAEAPLRLTTHPAPESSPAWSPDGQQIAFVREEDSTNVIATVPVIGGSERVLARFGKREIRGVVWSPDGQTLALAAQRAPYEAFSLYLLDIATRQRRRLTTPPAYYLGDTAPAFSPDGQTLAFSREVVERVQDVYTVPVRGGRVKRLTRDGADVSGLDWTADGRRIVFASDREGASKLWRVDAAGGAPEWIATAGGGKGLHQPSVARQGRGMTLTERSFDVNIWRLHRVEDYDRFSSHPAVASTRWDSNPAVAPDGERLAFASKRSGHFEIWTSQRDGSEPVQLTRFEGPFTATPRWAPDGGHLAFTSRRTGSADVYVIPATGGTPRQLSQGTAADLAPSFSRDGRHVYFASDRTGTWQIWRKPLGGGSARQMTTRGGFAAFEAPGGRHLYYVKKHTPGIWRRSLIAGEGAAEERVVEALEPYDWGNWAVTETGLYFIRRDLGARPLLSFYHFKSGRTWRVAFLDDVPRHPSLAVAPGAAWFLYTRIDRSESDIMLVENFR